MAVGGRRLSVSDPNGDTPLQDKSLAHHLRRRWSEPDCENPAEREQSRVRSGEGPPNTVQALGQPGRQYVVKAAFRGLRQPLEFVGR
jgi:hypothetical protein